MFRVRVLLTVIAFTFILLAHSESHAVIYRYMNEKGVTIFVNDKQMVPEQYREQAVIVSGTIVDEQAEAERARQAAEVLVRQEEVIVPAKTEERISARLIRSGIAIGLFSFVMFMISNIHGLHEQAQALKWIRITTALLLFVFLGYTHARDVTRLFGKAGEAVVDPITEIQEKSAERGRKAAEAYKALNKILEQGELPEEAKKEIEKKYDDGERGK